MDTFSPPVSPTSLPKSVKARVLETKFGDGYSQRAADGLNSIEEERPLAWENIDDADADYIETFLIAHGGYISFLWMPPKEGIAKAYVCKSWSRTPKSGEMSSMSATFTQSFELE